MARKKSHGDGTSSNRKVLRRIKETREFSAESSGSSNIVVVNDTPVDKSLSRTSSSSTESVSLEDVVVVEDVNSAEVLSWLSNVRQGSKDVFVSYSRRDKAYVLEIVKHIQWKLMKSVWIDLRDIPPAADWWEEISIGIRSSQYCVFVISSVWLSSEVCMKELAYAVDCGKIIVPLVIQDVRQSEVPPAIAKRNWVFLRPDDDRKVGFDNLNAALTENLEMVKKHTWLLQMAAVWDSKNRKADSLLQRTSAIKEAQDILNECAIGNGPPVVPLQVQFLNSSENLSRRHQRRNICLAGMFALLLATALAISIFYAISSKQSEVRAQTEQTRAEEARAASEEARAAAEESDQKAKVALQVAEKEKAAAEDSDQKARVALRVAEIEKAAAEKSDREARASLELVRRAQYSTLVSLSTAKGLPVSERLLLGAEGIRAMDKENMSGLSVAFDSFREALQSVGGGEWVYEGPIQSGYGYPHAISLDGDVVAVSTGGSSLLVISGLISRGYRYTRVQLNVSIFDATIRLSNNGTVLFVQPSDQRIIVVFHLSGDSRLITSATRVINLLKLSSDLLLTPNGLVLVAFYPSEQGTSRVAYWASAEDVLRGTEMAFISIKGVFDNWDKQMLTSCTDSSTGFSVILILAHVSQERTAHVHVLRPSSSDHPSAWPYWTLYIQFDHYKMRLPFVFDPTCTWMSLSSSPYAVLYKVDLPARFSSNVTDPAPTSVLYAEEIVLNGQPRQDRAADNCAVRWVSRNLHLFAIFCSQSYGYLKDTYSTISIMYGRFFFLHLKDTYTLRTHTQQFQ